MKTILVIGSGWEQHALIKAIKEDGHKVVATHPKMNTDGFSLADIFYVKDSRDIKGHLTIAETHKIDAVVTDNCDYSFYTASVIALKLGLPFAAIQSAIYSNNKFAQREQCNRGGIRQPVYEKVVTYEELVAAAEKIGFPVIVKPIDSRGTFGVTVIENKGQLQKAFVDAIDNSPSRVLICEKYISGTLVTVDGFCFKNGHRALTVASRRFEAGEKPVTKEIIYPALFSMDLNTKLLDNHNKVAKSLGYSFGHTHGEYIVDEKGDIYLVECANRGGGVYTSSVIVPLLTDIDLNRILLNQSLGVDDFETEDRGLQFMKKSAILTFLDFEVGRVIKSMNVEEMREKPYTVRFRSIYGKDDMVESIENCASRHSMLVIQGLDNDETKANYDRFLSDFKIEYYNR